MRSRRRALCAQGYGGGGLRQPENHPLSESAAHHCGAAHRGIGMRAEKRILARIQNPDAPPQREIVECSIIERESV